MSIVGSLGSSTTQRFDRHREAPPRWIAERRREDRAIESRATASTCGRKGHHSEDCRGAKKKIEKSEDALADKKDGGRRKF